ncbi:hypothetical protein [Streptomyces sp. NPDC051183]|uniref:hypothetical protein n=1 Tax=unclassified Streptomyces TaxID=2593676 RepID=UPI003418ABFA
MYGELWAWAQAEPGKAALAAVMIGVPAAGALAQQRQKEKAGRPGAGAPPTRAADALLVRFLSGRDLKPGDPSSSATWWCAGTQVRRDRTAADLAADPGPYEKETGGALRAVVSGARRWSCWPRAARTAVRLAVPAVAVSAWCGWWPAVVAVAGVLVLVGLVAAVTGPAVLSGLRSKSFGG